MKFADWYEQAAPRIQESCGADATLADILADHGVDYATDWMPVMMALTRATQLEMGPSPVALIQMLPPLAFMLGYAWACERSAPPTIEDAA